MARAVDRGPHGRAVEYHYVCLDCHGRIVGMPGMMFCPDCQGVLRPGGYIERPPGYVAPKPIRRTRKDHA